MVVVEGTTDGLAVEGSEKDEEMAETEGVGVAVGGVKLPADPNSWGR